MANLFPMFVKLEGRRCLVAGAGPVAEQKIESLLLSGAEVHVVAPEATESIRALAAGGQLQWSSRRFVSADLEGVSLVIAATGDAAVNGEIFRQAESRGIFCNAVDEPEHCRFYYGAVVRRGDLQIAVSTAGQSPALAQRLRVELEARYGREYGPFLQWLGKVRQRLFRRTMNPERRKQLLHQIAAPEVFERFASAKALPKGGQEKTPRLRACARDAAAASGGGRLKGKVFLVGAGPGDPELLTAKAIRLLRHADVVLHDDLVSPAILAMIPPAATVINIGKRCRNKFLTQEEINSLLIFHAAASNTVVRLKGGDPSIFGRAGEEIEALTQAGMEYEIVPGITSALASAAAAGISLTDRRYASSVIFTTGHRRPGERVKWKQLAAAGSTLAIYMPGSGYAELAGGLREAGLEEHTPCAVVSSAGLPAQQVLWTTLAGLELNSALPAPSLVIVGQCASALPQLQTPDWSRVSSATPERFAKPAEN
jgi:uroporphyrin-III C-methyltransferase/precorrin-2 dehydrogenase/sirohydrochlorin ferrochelatase